MSALSGMVLTMCARFVMLALCSLAVLWAVDVQAGDVNRGTPVPVEIINNLILTKVKINGKGPFDFFFDGAAKAPILEHKLARECELQLGAFYPGIPRCAVANLRELDVGGTTVDNIRVAVILPPAQWTTLEQAKLATRKPLLGILGNTWAENFLVTIDWRRKILFLDRGGRLEASQLAGRNPNAIAFEYVGNQMRVPVMINGKGPFLFLFDFGANHTILSPLVAQLAGLIPPLQGGAAAPANPKVEEIQIGTVKFKDVNVLITPIAGWGDTMADGKRFLGVIGNTVISRFTTVIDYKQRTVLFER